VLLFQDQSGIGAQQSQFRRPTDPTPTKDAVQALLNIEKEAALLAEVKDILDELNMIKTILKQQKLLILKFRAFAAEIYNQLPPELLDDLGVENVEYDSAVYSKFWAELSAPTLPTADVQQNREGFDVDRAFYNDPNDDDAPVQNTQTCDMADSQRANGNSNAAAGIYNDPVANDPPVQDVRTCDMLEFQRTINAIMDRHVNNAEDTLEDIERMEYQAERLYGRIRDILDLKQKHAIVVEARASRAQAEATHRQAAAAAQHGQTILVFTIVTVIFLPLSFLAAFFAININEFPHQNGNQQMPLAYASKWIFGLGLLIAAICIALAMWPGYIRPLMRKSRAYMRSVLERWHVLAPARQVLEK
jgi:hypothetical protein